jgi:TonB family protein
MFMPMRTTIALAGLVGLASACKDDASADAPAEAKAGEASGSEAKGTGAGGVAPAAAAPTEPPPSGHAVAKAGALLFASSTGDVGFELPPLPSAAGMTVNVVGEQDGRLVVETLVTEPTLEHHCAATLDGLSDFRLRLYLAREDLLPVLTEGLVHELGDGTTIRLARGVPVPAGSAELLVRGTAVRVPVPAERTGRFYEPAQPFARAGQEGEIVPLDGHALTYGGHTLDESSLYRDADRVLRFGVTERTGEALVTVRNPCLEATVLVSSARLHAEPSYRGRYGMLGSDDSGHFLASPYGGAFAAAGDDEDVWGGLTGTEVGEAFGVGGLGLVGTGRGAKAYEVKAGAAIVWADGSPAGQVTADHEFATPPRDEGGRSCFDAPIVTGQASTVTLCFAAGDVGEIESTTGWGSVGGLGTTGLIDTGSGFSGRGGAGFGGRGKRVPQVRQEKAAVTGSLDKDIIRRIVRAHINEVRYCYNQGLARDPALGGKVSIRFTVGPGGDVSAATIASSTLADEAVAECIAKAVKRWTFPKPAGGGAVVVTYPFVLEPG